MIQDCLCLLPIYWPGGSLGKQETIIIIRVSWVRFAVLGR